MSIALNGDGIISGVSTITNPSDITVGTGASVFSPSTNTLALGTNGSERIRVDSSGNFGVGTTTPTSDASRVLHVASSGPGSNVIIRATGNNGTGVDLISGGDGKAYLWNRDNTDLLFGTNNAEKLRVLAAGGLTFNGDTAAVNALDDYEEGTFTPYLEFASAGTATFGYDRQFGYYTKIGNVVNCRFEVRLNSFSKGTGSGTLEVKGMPFTIANQNSAGQFIGNIILFNASTPTTSGEYPCIIGALNTTQCSIRTFRNNTNFGEIPDPDGNAQYKMQITYQSD